MDKVLDNLTTAILDGNKDAVKGLATDDCKVILPDGKESDFTEYWVSFWKNREPLFLAEAIISHQEILLFDCFLETDVPS